MIINLRGTSGSGKSTLVKTVMDRCVKRIAVRAKDGGKRPIGYICELPNGKWLAVVGHYEIACGGCDTISDMNEVFARVKEAHDLGYHVLFEGAIVSTLARNVIELHLAGYPVEVISLNTPLDVCLASINDRRMAKHREREAAVRAYNKEIIDGKRRGKLKDVPPLPEPVNPKTTTQKFASTKSTHEKIVAAGIPAVWASREGALNLIATQLGLANVPSN